MAPLWQRGQTWRRAPRKDGIELKSIIAPVNLRAALDWVCMATNPLLKGAATAGELAQSREMRDLLQWFTREKQWISEQHLELCRIPAPTFLEHQRAEWMAAQFRSYGCEVHIDRAGNVIAFPAPDPKGQIGRAHV